MVAREEGIENAISFDMGGTSTDVCLIANGRAERSAGRTVAGFPVVLPTLDLHTVGAGGGSIVWRDSGGAVRVGPQSAGSDPGPACYGRGGTEPTVTDANLLLGRLPGRLAGDLELDRAAAERALAGFEPEDVVAAVNAEMLRALRVISVERGHDPRDFALVAFGGAGPLHACELADELEIETVVVPGAAGVLSALGLAASEERRDHVRSYVGPLEEAGELPASGEADVRYAGQSFELTVSLGGDVAATFHRAHEEHYGYAEPDRPLELVAVRTADVWPGPKFELPSADPLHARGPALVELDGATCWPLGGVGVRDGSSTLVLTRVNIELQVTGSALRAVAEEMGAALVRAAFSANIKERRDCSAALFAPDGRMVAQAEHIPVHLGAMPEAVAAVRARNPGPDDVYIVNDPYTGGTSRPTSRSSRAPTSASPSRARTTQMSAASSPAACRPSRGLLPRKASSFRLRTSTTTSSRTLCPACAIRTSGVGTCARRSPPTVSPSVASLSCASVAGESA